MRTHLRSLLLLLAFLAAVLGAALQPARAALQASPTWWGASAAASSTWHYRVPLALPGSPVANQTAVFNVDFNALLTSLGVSGTFDANSPRVVATDGTLVPTQEFTDAIYGGASDALGNARGEIRFLTTSSNASYWLYFDITANGSKAASTATPIDGNFENPGTVGSNSAAPTGWTVTRNTGAVDTQVRPTENPSIATDGTTVGNGASPRTVDGTPRSGQYSFLIGARTNNESRSAQDIMLLNRTITVPASNPGVLRVRFRVQGWDSNDDGNTGSFDYLEGTIIDGAAVKYFIGPLANNYVSLPFSPNKGTGQAGRSDSGYGQYNGFDMDTRGNHRANMTVALGAEPWWEATVDLAAYAGKTITLSFSTSHVVQYRSWWHIDDVEWSVINGTVGAPQGFGAALELPAGAATTQYAGDVLTIRARLDAVGKTGSVVADLYKPDGSLAKAGIVLYNDGSHGDATSGDAIWTNNGTVTAQGTYTFGASDPLGTWSVVLRGADSSTAASGQSNGLVRVPGQPVTPVTGANFSNVDVQSLTLAATMSISGKVYRDNNQNGTLDSGEPVATGVFVKLVQNGSTLQVATPDAAGAYAFTGLRGGTYTVLQSTNNNASDTSPSVPAGSVQTEPAGGGSRTVTLAGGVSATANFGQYGTATNRLAGKIFADTGAGNVNALDGAQGASEPGLAGLTVILRNAAGTTLATAVTAADGQFDLVLPSGVAGTQVTLVVPAVTGYELARFGVGNTGGTASLPAGTLVFTPASGNDYAGVVVSLLPISTLVQGQAKTVPPGSAVTYAHRFNADANGTVSFALASQPPSALPQWQGLLYRDNDCNGVIDGADALLQSSVQVLAGGSVCVVVRDLVPQSASINMVNQHQLSASFVVTQGVGHTAAAIVNLDVTTVGTTTGSGLTLTKAVRNLTTGSGWDTAGQAIPGQSLQYRLSFRNDTATPVTNVQVNDFLPAYAVFQSAACGVMPAGLACSVSASPAAGATAGAIQWSFTGSVAPGATGEVTFNWMLSN